MPQPTSRVVPEPSGSSRPEEAAGGVKVLVAGYVVRVVAVEGYCLQDGLEVDGIVDDTPPPPVVYVRSDLPAAEAAAFGMRLAERAHRARRRAEARGGDAQIEPDYS